MSMLKLHDTSGKEYIVSIFLIVLDVNVIILLRFYYIYYIIKVVNGMRKINNKGFTLIELLVTIIVLAIVLSISGYTVFNIFNKSKEKNYNILINDIKSASEMYYQECHYMDFDNCEKKDSYTIKLSELLKYGFLSSSDNDNYTLINPMNNKDISECEITIKIDNDTKKVIVLKASDNDICPSGY